MSGQSDGAYPTISTGRRNRAARAIRLAARLVVDRHTSQIRNLEMIPSTRWRSKFPLHLAPSSCQRQARIPVATTGSVDRLHVSTKKYWTSQWLPATLPRRL